MENASTAIFKLQNTPAFGEHIMLSDVCNT
jgi:hypothetical protein